VDLIGGIRNKGHQIKLEDATPLIKDLKIQDIFRDKDKKERTGVTDLINGLVGIL